MFAIARSFVLVLASTALGVLNVSPAAAARCGCSVRTRAVAPMISRLNFVTRSVVMKPDSGGALAKIYVADELSGTVSVIDAASNQRLHVVEISYREGDMVMTLAPHNVQVAPDGKTVWVTAPMPMGIANDGGACDGACAPLTDMKMDEEVVVLDAVTDQVIARIPIPAKASNLMLHLAHVVLDKDSRFAYVTANYGSLIIKIDARTYKEVARFELGADRGPHGMRMCGGQLFVANMYTKSLGIVDPVSGKVTEVKLGGVAVQTACRPDGKSVFVSLYDTREVARYDIATHRVTRVALPEGSQGPIQLYVTPDERHVYVADQGNLYGRPASHLLYEVDVARAAVTATIETGSAPHGVVTDDKGTFAYVSNVLSNSVTVVDLLTKRVVATIPVGNGPNGIGFLYATGGMP